MSRFLVLSLLAACSFGRHAPPPAIDPIDDWLTHWNTARRCVVADAENTQTGVTIAFLQGRNCETELHELAEVSTFDSLAPAAKLVEAIWVQPSVPEKRAAAVDATDRLARDLGRRVGRDVSPPTRARALTLLQPKAALEHGFGARFNGGMIRQYSPDTEIVITGTGQKQEYQALQGNRETVNPSDRLASMVTETQRVVVWRTPAADHAYEIDVSSDGQHWTTTEAPKGTSYIDHWQDPRTRIVEIAVRSESKFAIHRISPKQLTPVVRLVESSPHAGVSNCTHSGVLWTLRANAVERFGDKPARLGNWTSAGHIDCRGAVALINSHWPDALERCRESCDTVFKSPNNHEGRSALLDDGRWIYAVILDDVLGVWTESVREPEFYRIPKGATLEAISVLDGKPSLVLDSDKNFQFVPL